MRKKNAILPSSSREFSKLATFFRIVSTYNVQAAMSSKKVRDDF